MQAEVIGALGILSWGLNVEDWPQLVARLGVGVPFAISGLNKLFCPTCHGWLRSNLTRSRIPCPSFSVWWVAGWEAMAGITLTLGLMTGASAFVLFIVCVVAFIVSWRRKIEAKKPAHFWDACTEIGFMFDVLLLWLLAVIMFTGPGALSLDAVLFPQLKP